MTVIVSFDGEVIKAKKMSELLALMHLQSDNIVVAGDVYIIDESTLDEDKRVIQLVVHQF